MFPTVYFILKQLYRKLTNSRFDQPIHGPPAFSKIHALFGNLYVRFEHIRHCEFLRILTRCMPFWHSFERKSYFRPKRKGSGSLWERKHLASRRKINKFYYVYK